MTDDPIVTVTVSFTVPLRASWRNLHAHHPMPIHVVAAGFSALAGDAIFLVIVDGGRLSRVWAQDVVMVEPRSKEDAP